jgi:hypothetical protein
MRWSSIIWSALVGAGAFMLPEVVRHPLFTLFLQVALTIAAGVAVDLTTKQHKFWNGMVVGAGLTFGFLAVPVHKLLEGLPDSPNDPFSGWILLGLAALSSPVYWATVGAISFLSAHARGSHASVRASC